MLKVMIGLQSVLFGLVLAGEQKRLDLEAACPYRNIWAVCQKKKLWQQPRKCNRSLEFRRLRPAANDRLRHQSPKAPDYRVRRN